MSATAILKHIAVKSSNYAKMQQYLLFKHDPRHRQPILDEEGRMIFREVVIMGGINCDPFIFDTDCIQLNQKYGKNCDFDEIKAHHYIISFDPRDKTEKPFTERTFSTILRNNEGKLNITYDKNLDAGYGKKARGYHGVHALINVHDRLC